VRTSGYWGHLETHKTITNDITTRGRHVHLCLKGAAKRSSNFAGVGWGRLIVLRTTQASNHDRKISVQSGYFCLLADAAMRYYNQAASGGIGPQKEIWVAQNSVGVGPTDQHLVYALATTRAASWEKSMSHARFVVPLALIGLLPAVAAAAETPFFFSTGDPDGKIATATRPDTGAPFEIESADDFVLTQSTSITSATFTGLMPVGASAEDVVVEIYRVFPKESDTSRTSGLPTFSTPNVPTRVNSPSDLAFDERDSSTSGLNFVISNQGGFAAGNSVQPGGIRPLPDNFTTGNGGVSGIETEFTITFAIPFALPADHYFFVPQVQLSEGDFLWLSAAKPIDASGTPFPAGFTDLQSWTRDDSEGGIAPDWLRIGADITHQGPFNAAFSLSGSVIPEPSTWAMMLLGFAGLSLAGIGTRKTAKLQADRKIT
jgi:PEP-CTERM motif